MSLTLSHALLLSINAVIFVNKNARVVSASQTYPSLNYQIVDISQDEGLTLDASCPIKKRKKAKNCQNYANYCLTIETVCVKLQISVATRSSCCLGVETTSGLPDATVNAIIKIRDSIQCTADVVSMGVVCESHACHIYEVFISLNFQNMSYTIMSETSGKLHLLINERHHFCIRKCWLHEVTQFNQLFHLGRQARCYYAIKMILWCV